MESLALHLLILPSSQMFLESSHTRSILCSNHLVNSASYSDKIKTLLILSRSIWSVRTLHLISVPLSSSYDGLLALPWARRHSPALVHWHWRLPCLERTCPRHPRGHSFMSFPSLLKGHLLNEAHTDRASKTATFPVPTHLHAGSPSSKHLPTFNVNTSLTY